VVALDIVCLQEYLTWCRKLHWLWQDMDRRGEGALWIRKTVLRFEHTRLLPTFPDVAHPFTFPSAYSALAPRRASHAQPDDRDWPKSQRSSTVREDEAI